jgi:regulator of protease activity HflC (stomatin/prohibitin superfamily)
MVMLRKIRTFERGLLFKAGEFQELVGPGWFTRFALFGRSRLDIVSLRAPWLVHKDLDLVVRSGALRDEALVLDLADHERAFVWVDDRFEALLGPGLHALWTTFRKVRVEVVDARALRFTHDELAAILAHPSAEKQLTTLLIPEGHVGLVFKDGELFAQLQPGRYAFWKEFARVDFHVLEMREVMLDVAGQEIMTADKVTLRLNAVVTFRVADAARAVRQVDDFKQALYRHAQLVLRGVVGTRELDRLLVEKDAMARELEDGLRARAEELGLNLVSVGVRDVMLPGEMRELLNKVTEAKKAAEASLITRREETAAMRSQANTAKLLEGNPTLMRLRELEALERIAEKAKLSVVVGEKGLEKVVNLL